MTILVTGASGRIGKNLVGRLIADREDVRILVRRTGTEKIPGTSVFIGDVEKGNFESAFRDVNIVYHLAADVKLTDPYKKLFQANVVGTRNVAKFAKEAGAKVVFMSSVGAMGHKFKELPADENTVCKADTNYGKTKFLAEQELEKSGADFVTLRGAKVYGAGFYEGYLTIIEATEKKKMPILGKGENHVHFVHVSDVIQALLLAGKNKSIDGETFIIADNEAKTLKELLYILADALQVPRPTKQISVSLAKTAALISGVKSKVLKGKPKLTTQDILDITADRMFSIEKAKDKLGYTPKIDIVSGITEMVRWYQSLK